MADSAPQTTYVPRPAYPRPMNPGKPAPKGLSPPAHPKAKTAGAPRMDPLRLAAMLKIMANRNK